MYLDAELVSNWCQRNSTIGVKRPDAANFFVNYEDYDGNGFRSRLISVQKRMTWADFLIITIQIRNINQCYFTGFSEFLKAFCETGF